VLNVFSSQSVVGVCPRVGGCGGIALGEPYSWQQPRRWELGLRVEF
jgi:hypothetical protein